jgi:hypothetical protein
MLRFVFPSLTFNKLPLHPSVLPWILPVGHKGFGSLLLTDCTGAINIWTEQGQTFFFPWAQYLHRIRSYKQSGGDLRYTGGLHTFCAHTT